LNSRGKQAKESNNKKCQIRGVSGDKASKIQTPGRRRRTDATGQETVVYAQ
jgi:hypothetical protein